MTVVAIEACPASFWITAALTPAIAKWLQKVRRRSCIVQRWMLEFSTIAMKSRWTLLPALLACQWAGGYVYFMQRIRNGGIAMKKLTLSASEDVIRDAKRLAAERGTSVSAMFSRFIRSVAHEEERGQRGSDTPILRELTGTMPWPEGKTYEDLLTEALMEKHGLSDGGRS